jgi:hypothetical protein
MTVRLTRRELLKSMGSAAALSLWPRLSVPEAPPGAALLHYATLADVATLIESRQVSPVEGR